MHTGMAMWGWAANGLAVFVIAMHAIGRGVSGKTRVRIAGCTSLLACLVVCLYGSLAGLVPAGEYSAKSIAVDVALSLCVIAVWVIARSSVRFLLDSHDADADRILARLGVYVTYWWALICFWTRVRIGL